MCLMTSRCLRQRWPYVQMVSASTPRSRTTSSQLTRPLGMDRLHRSMSTYVKWLNARNQGQDDKEKGLPTQFLGRIMTGHGDDFEPDSEFGACLVTLGRTNEQLAGIQENYSMAATDIWLESLERNLAMMKDYHVSPLRLFSVT